VVQVVANGVRIECRVEGDAKAPAILLIRGLGTQMSQWPVTFTDGLCAAGLRVVRFDNRDVGLSQKFDAAGVPDIAKAVAAMRAGETPVVPYTLDAMAADCIGVLDALEIGRAHVLGISMGVMIAQLVAARHPDRTRSLISVMSSSGHPSVPPGRPEAMAVLTSQPDRPGERSSVIEHGLAGRRVIGSPGYRDPDDTVRAELGVAFDRCHHPAGVARQLAAVIAAGSRAELLARIRVPTLVIHGTDDPLVQPEGGRDTARRIPQASLELIPGMGHDIPQGLVRRLVDLVAEHTRKADLASARVAS
jgi:pimeloyl-ACP methyl ester carboxylesterase